MELRKLFNLTGAPVEPQENPKPKQRRKRPAPFSVRLSHAEKARLLEEAKDVPLGAYIKAKALGGDTPIRLRRSGLPLEDRQALAKALAVLGQSRVSSNLNQLAHAANMGVLSLDDATARDLKRAIEDVHHMRALLIRALGLKPEGEE